MQIGGVAADEEMVVATPERVAFEYEVAGIGSRFLAQAIDLILLTVVLFAATFIAAFIGILGKNSNLAELLLLLLSFLIIVGYFPICEGVWSGQTLGKRALRIRVMGERGEPVTVSQVMIRNLIRIVDFLPVFYGVGLITIFIQGGGKRLGDFAAGTVVARERGRIRLKDLVAAAEASTVAAAPVAMTPRSIWADRRDPADVEDADVSQAAPVAAASAASPYENALRRIDPKMRSFIAAYARRRNELPPERRSGLAEQVGSELARLLPTEVSVYGAVAVLDGLAALMYAETARSAPPRSPALPPPLPPPSSGG